MKTGCHNVIGVFLAVVGLMATGHGAETPKPAPAVTKDAETTAVRPAMVVVGTANVPAKNRSTLENEARAQERLAASTPDQLIERHGFFGSLFARPQRMNPLQLINPAAPREYGGVGASTTGWSWNPMLAPGQGPLPRAFRDDRTHEASAVVLGHSFN
jgi:hypothetical protein